jgi:hypothetical protein
VRSLGVCRWALTTLLLFALGSCALVGTTRKERMMRLETGLNENRPQLYQDFLEDATSDYAVLQTTDVGQTWDVWFPTGYPDAETYTLTFVQFLSGADQGVLASVTGPAAFGGPRDLELHMARVGLDWYLVELVLDGTVIVQ